MKNARITNSITTIKNLNQSKTALESRLKDDWQRIQKDNQIVSGARRAFDIKTCYSFIEKTEKELISVKIAIQAANMGFKKMSEIPSDSIYEKIFELSLLKTRKSNLEKLINNGSKNGPVKIAGGQTVIFESVLSTATLQVELNKVEEKIDEIETFLYTFNEKTFNNDTDLPF